MSALNARKSRVLGGVNAKTLFGSCDNKWEKRGVIINREGSAKVED